MQWIELVEKKNIILKVDSSVCNHEIRGKVEYIYILYRLEIVFIQLIVVAFEISIKKKQSGFFRDVASLFVHRKHIIILKYFLNINKLTVLVKSYIHISL